MLLPWIAILLLSARPLLAKHGAVSRFLYFPMSAQAFEDVTENNIADLGYDLTSVVKAADSRIVSILSSATSATNNFQAGEIRIKITRTGEEPILVDLMRDVKIGSSVRRLDVTQYREVYRLIHDELPDD